MARKKLKKHKAFGKVRSEIAKKIREHKRRKKTAKAAKRKELDLAVKNLESLSKAVALAFTARKTCPI